MASRVSKWDKIFNVVYSIGASIVILGVVGKLSHASWGDYALYLGLIVEAIIFFFSAFDPPAGEYAWERVYPELSEESSTKKGFAPLKIQESKDKNALSSESFKQLIESMESLRKITENLRHGADLAALDKLKGVPSPEVAQDMLKAWEQTLAETRAFNANMQALSDKLSSMNKVYEGMLTAMSRTQNPS